MQININLRLFAIYFLLINLVNFYLFAWDKRCAQKGTWRIREKDLFMLAIIGGSIGGFLGMHLFHHKTLHPKFRYGFPTILLIQVIALFAYYLFG
ncbi:MAG: DUF1294 domain-containing protein [Syntrophomonadaceae bacterium]|jgi:uncharacterized membrane protein YsdA (DUF1294 family)